MALPHGFDYSLPYFEYGFHKPNEPAFNDIDKYIIERKEYELKNSEIIICDGIPILRLRENEPGVNGYIYAFNKEYSERAYELISRHLPYSLFQWRITEGDTKLNVAISRDDIHAYLMRGDTKQKQWNGKDDPMFNEAMNNIKETVEAERSKLKPINIDSYNAYSPAEDDWKRIFEIQKAYLLLNAVLDRFLLFRYGFSGAENMVMQDQMLREDPLFERALLSAGTDSRTVFDYRHPEKGKKLDAGNPKNSLQYYRQVRHNLIHRGKVGSDDAEMMRKSLNEFYDIIKNVLDKSYSSSRSAPAIPG